MGMKKKMMSSLKVNSDLRNVLDCLGTKSDEDYAVTSMLRVRIPTFERLVSCLGTWTYTTWGLLFNLFFLPFSRDSPIQRTLWTSSYHYSMQQMFPRIREEDREKPASENLCCRCTTSDSRSHRLWQNWRAWWGLEYFPDMATWKWGWWRNEELDHQV